uniref:Uncharacterized protein n=1 Tax=Cliftonaea pectinata TaxID=2007206 RepID=A0A1Z1MQ45_9FLOR|nr:hypothetical protein [Cliftonaea pectinata]ARW68178.1 hypothetical protein [Cliftonaea pectinata]
MLLYDRSINHLQVFFHTFLETSLYFEIYLSYCFFCILL